MIRLEKKNCNMTTTEKQQRYQHCHQVKLMNINVTDEKLLPSDQRRIKEQVNFTYSQIRNQKEFRIKKEIQRKDAKLYVKRKVYDN